MKSRPSRVIASILALSIVVAAPGTQAWGRVAVTVRPGSVGAGFAGQTRSITPSSNVSIPAISLAPSLTLAAPSLSAPNPAPVPSALTAAVLPAPAGAPASAGATPIVVPAALKAVVPAAGVPAAMSVLKPEALTAALSAAAKDMGPGAEDKGAQNEGALSRLSSIFDGIFARRPAADAAADSLPSGDGPDHSNGLGASRQARVPVVVTLQDPGSVDALSLALGKMRNDLDFRRDEGYGAVTAPGFVTVRGEIPLSNLKALASAPGVVSVAPTSGRATLVDSPVPAPARESLLRAGMRSLMLQRPRIGFIALRSLQFLYIAAFMGPAMGNNVLVGAAAALKPWMLGTVLGMSHLFSLIPLKLRVFATYSTAAGLAWTFYALVPGLPAIWLAANILLSLLATRGSMGALAKPANKNPLETALNATESAAFLNILGYQALIPILVLSGMLPLAFGILAVSTALSLALLIKSRSKAALPVDPLAPVRESFQPFVPATKVIADMQKLFKADPAAGLDAAAAAIVDETERRAEVKIAAQRILDSLPLEQTLPHYLDLLELTARADVKTSKNVKSDRWWYLQRTALKRLARDASALKPGADELIDALRTTYKDPNPSVRLAAAEALTALGIDPGPEVIPAPAPRAPQAPEKIKLLKWQWAAILLVAFVLGWMVTSTLLPALAPPALMHALLHAFMQAIKWLGESWLMLFWIGLIVWVLKTYKGASLGSAAKLTVDKPTTHFNDVAGMDETLVEMQEILDFLRDPSRFKKLGARMPKGILMDGPPGTGKTLLARALAGETGAAFISISGSDFVELYVGNGARKVRDLFELARENAPAIIFIDEIDAVGKKRGGGGGGGGHDEREQTLNQILKEMDGFDNTSGVIVVAATNLLSTLDDALTRPGRFDRKIHVGYPEALGREAILALHAKRNRLSPEVDLRLIARRTAGLSGAFLEGILNEAAMLAARRGGDSINAADIDEAVDRQTIGGKRSLRLSDDLKRRISVHEAGHVLANLLNEKPELRTTVNKVTIVPHGSGALGFAESSSKEGEEHLLTRGQLEARLDTALGGLVAEFIVYGEWSTGPGADLEAATRVARAMAQQLGMSDEMGLAQTQPDQHGLSPFGAQIDAKAHRAVNRLLNESKARVEKRLREGSDELKAMVEAMMEKETLSADEIEAIAHPRLK